MDVDEHLRRLVAKEDGLGPECTCAQILAADERRHFKGCERRDLYPAGEVDPEIVRLRAWAEAADAFVREHVTRCGRDDCDAPATHYTWALVGPWRYRCEEHREQPVDGRRDSEEEGVATWLRARAGLATERP